MSTTVRAVLFRTDAEEPEWIEMPVDDGAYFDRLHELLDCTMFEAVCISPTLTLMVDEEGLLKHKPRNLCFSKYKPYADYADFFGDVLLVCADADADETKKSVLEHQLVELPSILDADLKQRADFYANIV